MTLNGMGRVRTNWGQVLEGSAEEATRGLGRRWRGYGLGQRSRDQTWNRRQVLTLASERGSDRVKKEGRRELEKGRVVYHGRTVKQNKHL